MSLIIRTLHDADLDVADAVAVAAYNSPHSRKASLQTYLRLQPDGWLLALQDNEPVGLGGLTSYGAFAYLGMMSVLPTAQGKGIGKQLITHLLRWADEQACPTILLDATEAGSYLYKSFDFVEINKTQQWYCVGLDKINRPCQPDESVTDIRADDLPALAALDASYFGASRLPILETMLDQYPQRAFVARDPNGHVTGYLFAQGRSIGPWVANNIEAAEQLLARALSLSFQGNMVSVNISSANDDGIQLLERYKFIRQRTLSHMQRGKAIQRDLRKIYAQAAFALG